MSEIKALEMLREAATYNPAFSDNATRIACNYLSEIETEIERDYMKLPVDADGISIHIGDKVIPLSGVELTVNVLHLVNDDWWIGEVEGVRYKASSCTHKPDQLVELLKEFAKDYLAFYHDNYMNYDGTDKHVVEKHAERIRELMKEDGDD